MTLTLDNFASFEVETASVAAYKNFEAAQTGSSGALASIVAADGVLGNKRLLLDPGLTAQTFWRTELWGGVGTFVTTVWVTFSQVDISLAGATEIFFIQCIDAAGNTDWQISLKGEAGPGFATHRFYFRDSNLVSTPFANDPATVNQKLKLDIRWTHAGNALVQFTIDDAPPATPAIGGQDLLTLGAAGSVLFRLEGHGSLIAPQSTGHVDLLTHSESTTSSDLPSPTCRTKEIRPKGRTGIGANSDCDELGNTPGNAISLGEVPNIYDDTAATVRCTGNVGATTGRAWACNSDPLWRGPAGRFQPGTTIIGIKYILWFDGALTAINGIIAGKANADLSAFTVKDVASPAIRNNKHVTTIILPGDAEYPDFASGEWLALGMSSDAGVGFTFIEQVWGIVLYDPDTDIVPLTMLGNMAIEGQVTGL